MISVSIVSNSPEFLSIVLRGLVSPVVKEVCVVDNGGRSICYSIAALKMLDLLSEEGKKVTVQRLKKKVSMTELRKAQAEMCEGPVLFLDDDITVTNSFLSEVDAKIQMYDLVSHTVASLDDAENFGIVSPVIDTNIPEKWLETSKKTEVEKVVFWSACTAINEKARKFLLTLTDMINEGEEAIIEKRFKENKFTGLILSGHRVFHLGNEWTKGDLLRKTDSAREALYGLV